MTARRLSLLLAVAAAGLLLSRNANAGEYGTITGKFVLDGPVPKRAYVIKGGKLVKTGLPPKNPEVCAANDLKSDEFIVDPKGKGIGNIFVYLRKAPPDIAPELKKTPKKVLEFDQIGCRFVPHALFVRTGQTVKVLSKDNCSHNLHTYPLLNEAENFIVTPKFRKGVPLTHESAEPLPIKVGCDIHPWMAAYWLILDHPYAAVTASAPKVDKAKKTEDGSVIGTFTIEKVPYGVHEFRVWHERAGYIGVGTKRGFKVEVDKPVVRLEPFKVPLKAFD